MYFIFSGNKRTVPKSIAATSLLYFSCPFGLMEKYIMYTKWKVSLLTQIVSFSGYVSVYIIMCV